MRQSHPPIDSLLDSLRSDVRVMESVVTDYDFAAAIYRALAGLRWKSMSGEVFSSWRYAAECVVELRGLDEDYCEFYCSGGEGTVTEEIRGLFLRFGWTEVQDKESVV